VKGILRLILLFALVFLSRIPFLAAGFGADPDAWRIANAANEIHDSGTYASSRLPGYPVVEFALSLTGVHQAWQCNIITAVLTAGAAVCLVLLTLRFGIRNGNAAAIAFVFTPVVFVASVTTMDYLWALFFALASLTALAYRRYTVAAILMGVAIGCRITTVLIILPACIIALNRDMTARAFRKAAGFAIGSILVGILCYVPVYARHGWGFFSFVEVSHSSILQLSRVALIDAWGVIGLVAAGWATLVWISKSRQGSALTTIEIASLTAIILTVAVFIRLPGESGYLIPMIPFAFLLLAATLSRWQMNLVAVSMAASSFLMGVDSVDRPWSPTPSQASTTIRLSGRLIALDLLRGPILHDYDVRRQRLIYSYRAICSMEAEKGNSKLICGVWYPQISFLSHRKNEELFVELPDSNNAARIQADGTALVFIPGVDTYVRETYGYDIRLLGAKELVLR
jgi:hypothetical protein